MIARLFPFDGLQFRLQGFDGCAQFFPVLLGRLLRARRAGLVDVGGELGDFLGAFLGFGFVPGGNFRRPRLHQIANRESVIVRLARIFRGHDLGQLDLLAVNRLPNLVHCRGNHHAEQKEQVVVAGQYVGRAQLKVFEIAPFQDASPIRIGDAMGERRQSQAQIGQNEGDKSHGQSLMPNLPKPKIIAP